MAQVCCTLWILVVHVGSLSSGMVNIALILLTHVPVDGAVVGSNADGFFDSSCKIVHLPAYYARTLQCKVVAFLCLVFKDGWKVLLYFP